MDRKVHLRTPFGNEIGIDFLLTDVFPHQSRKTDDQSQSTSVLCNIENHILPSARLRGPGVACPFQGNLKEWIDFSLEY